MVEVIVFLERHFCLPVCTHLVSMVRGIRVREGERNRILLLYFSN